MIVDSLKSSGDELRQLYAASALSSVTMHYTEFVKHDLPALLMDIYNCDSKENLDTVIIVLKLQLQSVRNCDTFNVLNHLNPQIHTTADYLLPTTNRAAAAHSIMKFYQSRVFYEEICKHGFIKRSMQIVIDHEQYEDDLIFCVIRYFLFRFSLKSSQRTFPPPKLFSLELLKAC